MAYSSWGTTANISGWYISTLLASLTQTTQTGTPTSLQFATNANDANMKVSLALGTATPGASPLYWNGTGAQAIWANTYECYGTGWATGGIALSAAAAGSTDVSASCSLTGSQPYALTYTWANALSVASTTLTGACGMIIYFPSITAPNAKPCLLAINFGSTSGYSTVAGTFGVTPSGSGLAAITLTQ